MVMQDKFKPRNREQTTTVTHGTRWGKRHWAPLLILILTACGDTGCNVEEYTQRVNGEFQRCISFQCPGHVKEITCRKI
jgi:hypothetical protein